MLIQQIDCMGVANHKLYSSPAHLIRSRGVAIYFMGRGYSGTGGVVIAPLALPTFKLIS